MAQTEIDADKFPAHTRPVPKPQRRNADLRIGPAPVAERKNKTTIII
jgi:hypothetical protein